MLVLGVDTPTGTCDVPATPVLLAPRLELGLEVGFEGEGTASVVDDDMILPY